MHGGNCVRCYDEILKIAELVASVKVVTQAINWLIGKWQGAVANKGSFSG